MDGIVSRYKTREWLIKSITKVAASKDTCDIHIDELLGKEYYKTLKPKEVLQTCCIFMDIIDELLQELDINLNGIGIYISISLTSEQSIFQGAPKNLSELEELVETYFVPEIIIYSIIQSEIIPLIEFYRVPIHFEVYNFRRKAMLLYKEYRDSQLAIINANEEFTRSINIVFQNYTY
ncbi:hypothetical protein [Xanthocytophaga flava]|nr:hypothetical protein [Xanthocytophaga flavus]MDJ1467025.1 hypothetical protein [Xanthocytophaga flavus]